MSPRSPESPRDFGDLSGARRALPAHTTQPTSGGLGRRTASVDDATFRRSLLWTAIGTFVPGLGLWRAGRKAAGIVVLALSALVVGGVVVTAMVNRAFLESLAVNSGFLYATAWVLAVIAVLWVGVVVFTHVALRPRPATVVHRIIGAVVVGVLSLVITTPLALAARLTYDQAGFVEAVFGTSGDNSSATRPNLDAWDPWKNKDFVNILVLGGDSGAGRDVTLGARTDTIILVSVNTRTGAAAMFSLPRQTARMPFPKTSPLYKLYPNGFYDGKDPFNAEYFLNAMYDNVPAETGPTVLGPTRNLGADVLKQSVGEALGVGVDYYVMVNLDGFVDVVDALGGVYLNVNYPVAVGGDNDTGVKPDAWIAPGPNQLMNGYLALIYARSRYNSDDFHRMARQRCVVNAVIKQANPTNILAHYEALTTAGKKIILTDIPREVLPALLELALKVKGQGIQAVLWKDGVDGFVAANPPFDRMRAHVQEVLRQLSAPPATIAPQPATSSTAASTATTTSKATATATQTAASQNLDDDCAYHPTTN